MKTVNETETVFLGHCRQNQHIKIMIPTTGGKGGARVWVYVCGLGGGGGGGERDDEIQSQLCSGTASTQMGHFKRMPHSSRAVSGPLTEASVRCAFPQQTSNGGIGNTGSFGSLNGSGPFMYQLQSSVNVFLAVTFVAWHIAPQRTIHNIPWNKHQERSSEVENCFLGLTNIFWALSYSYESNTHLRFVSSLNNGDAPNYESGFVGELIAMKMIPSCKRTQRRKTARTGAREMGTTIQDAKPMSGAVHVGKHSIQQSPTKLWLVTVKRIRGCSM